MSKKLTPYVPTPEDLLFFRNTLEFIVKDGGYWTVPRVGMVYRTDRTKKTLTLQEGVGWDHSPVTMLTHHRNDCCCRAIGWSVEPAIDWDSMDCSPPEEAVVAGPADADELDESTPDDPLAFPVDLICVDHNEVSYGAGKIFVRVGGGDGTPFVAVALMAGEAKRITTPSLAAAWLIKHGLPEDDANALVADAMGTPEDQVATKDKPPVVPVSDDLPAQP